MQAIGHWLNRTYVISAALTLAACNQAPATDQRADAGNAATTPNVSAPTTTIEPDDRDPSSRFITIEADQAIGGKRPSITLVCKGGGEPGFQLRVVVAAPIPPPLAGVYGRFSFDRKAAAPLELGWMTGDTWTARNDAAAEARIVRAFIAAEHVSFVPPDRYAGNEPITWTAATFVRQREAIERVCLGGKNA